MALNFKSTTLIALIVLAAFVSSASACIPDCPACTKSWEPDVEDGCGGICPQDNCPTSQRCSTSAGYICVNRDSDSDCVPDCTECRKAGDDRSDGCGGICPMDNCPDGWRCSYSNGAVCIPEDSDGVCGDTCERECTYDDRELPIDDCGRQCPEKRCPSGQRCSASSGWVCIEDTRNCSDECDRSCTKSLLHAPVDSCNRTCERRDCPSGYRCSASAGWECVSTTPLCGDTCQRECTYAHLPVPEDNCGNECERRDCPSGYRCSASSGWICIEDDDADCGDVCDRECTKSDRSTPVDDCGRTCERRDCPSGYRCSSSAGWECVRDDSDDEDCGDVCDRECTYADLPVPEDDCGNDCPRRDCPSGYRCSRSSGWICIEDESDDDEPDCPQCTPAGHSPPSGCVSTACVSGTRCSRSSGEICVAGTESSSCEALCWACLKDGQDEDDAPSVDGCGRSCPSPSSSCPSGYRCSASSGHICVRSSSSDDSCTPDCPDCVKAGEDYDDGCGGFCPEGGCSSGFRCSASSGHVCVVDSESRDNDDDDDDADLDEDFLARHHPRDYVPSRGSIRTSSRNWTGGLIVPTYWPWWRDEGVEGYKNMVAAARTLDPGRLIVVINPHNGPGDPDSSYVGDFARFAEDVRDAGQYVCGYIYTDYAERSLSSVRREINEYVDNLENEIDCIMLDEALTQRGNEDYYEAIVDMFEDIVPGRYGTIFNPGAVNEQTGPFAEMGANSVIYETSAAKFMARTPSDGSQAYDWMVIGDDIMEKTAIMIHTEDDWEDTRDRAAAVGIRWYSVTYLDFDPNPWQRPPTYLQQMVDDALATNRVRSRRSVDLL